MAYDQDNIFARIVRGEIPCHRVYEDDHGLATLFNEGSAARGVRIHLHIVLTDPLRSDCTGPT